MSSAAFDYVIVGAGSAGCVLANRLSEDPDVRVAVLEAGGPDSAPEIHMASGYVFLFKTSVDWDLFGEPEPGLGNRRLYLPRGRLLGGSSSIKAQIYIRGNRADYDGWGFDGWRYDDVLPYFKRAEDNERGEDAFHGVGGPLGVSDGRSEHPLVTAMVEASKATATSSTRTSTAPARRASGRFSSPSATARLAARGHHGVRPPRRAHGLPPDLELRDGRRGGRGAACLRVRGPARRGCLGDAVDHARQHERADDHDRREGR